MRLRPALTVAAATLLSAGCGGRPAVAPAIPSPSRAARPLRPATAAGGSPATAPAAGASAAAQPTAAVPAGAAPAPAAVTTASLSFTAVLTVSLAGGGGSFTYGYTADGVRISMDSDGTFDGTAPIQATLVLNGNGCSLDLRLVNPQIEIAGSLSDDGRTLRIASIRISQDDVAGSGDCAGDGGGSPDVHGIGAGTANLSPPAPVTLPFSDGVGVNLPRPAAVERYPRSTSVQWSGAVRLCLPSN